MRAFMLLVAVLATSSAMTSAYIFNPLLLGLVGLKVLAIGGGGSLLAGIGKRSVRQGELTVDENLLLTTVTQLDPNGCILKLLCSLQAKPEEARTTEEANLVRMFSDNQDSLTSANAAFVYAAGVGRETQDVASCDKLFSKCLMEEEQLSRVLQQSWSCGEQVLH
ncbi:hypothetical protein Pmani_009881 [Petrolisthes manimaculis]|uniref:Uncharacterized protein n=1 Tax=Petrolisthes manimaculis TaxID=1843537 RepID=A0AAE1Q5J0_9EUCA|nr:hypothetical protein Pmani_009881 [Petrolisthes manimaculis]